MSQSTHYASEIKNRSNIGNKVLKQYRNIVKIKFFIYLPHIKSTQKKREITSRIRNLGGEITYSVNKSVNFLVVSDQTFKLPNKALLQGGAILHEAGPSENDIPENSAEKSVVTKKQLMNDRSIKFLSSRTNGRNVSKSGSKEVKLTPNKQYKHKVEFNNLFEFLNCKKWNLISVSDLLYKLNVLESDSLEWHIEKGFNPNSDREAAHYIVTSIKGEKKSDKNMNFHTFQFNPKINKYDVSKLNPEAPEGTSIFQTAAENEIALENYVKLMNKHESNVHHLKEIPSCKSQIEEQQPLNTSTMCTICGIKSYNYFAHINSSHHKKCVRKFDREYAKIDMLCIEMNSENEGAIKKPVMKKIPKPGSCVEIVKEKRRVIKRKIKEKTKEEQKMIQYVQDRLVVMQIETQSQPLNKAQNQNNIMIEHCNTKNSNDAKKCYSPNSNSCEMTQNCERPYPYISKRVRRHVAKRPNKVYDYDMAPKKRAQKRIRRNKRLRQTYFASNFNNLNKSCDSINKKRQRLVDTTLDMYFPVRETVGNEMEVDAE